LTDFECRRQLFRIFSLKTHLIGVFNNRNASQFASQSGMKPTTLAPLKVKPKQFFLTLSLYTDALVLCKILQAQHIFMLKTCFFFFFLLTVPIYYFYTISYGNRIRFDHDHHMARTLRIHITEIEKESFVTNLFQVFLFFGVNGSRFHFSACFSINFGHEHIIKIAILKSKVRGRLFCSGG
jgi:hypothetical protein